MKKPKHNNVINVIGSVFEPCTCPVCVYVCISTLTSATAPSPTYVVSLIPANLCGTYCKLPKLNENMSVPRRRVTIFVLHCLPCTHVCDRSYPASHRTPSPHESTESKPITPHTDQPSRDHTLPHFSNPCPSPRFPIPRSDPIRYLSPIHGPSIAHSTIHSLYPYSPILARTPYCLTHDPFLPYNCPTSPTPFSCRKAITLIDGPMQQQIPLEGVGCWRQVRRRKALLPPLLLKTLDCEMTTILLHPPTIPDTSPYTWQIRLLLAIRLEFVKLGTRIQRASQLCLSGPVVGVCYKKV